MIIKHIKEALVFKNLNKVYGINDNFLKHKFSTTPQQEKETQNYIEQYRNRLLKQNFTSIKNEYVKMKKCSKSHTNKLKKIELINELCQLQQQTIKNRLSQIRNKTILQLNSGATFRQQAGNFKNEEDNIISEKQKKQNQVQQMQAQFPLYEKNNTAANILKESLHKLLTSDHYKIMHSQRISNTHIMDKLYESWFQKNKQVSANVQNYVLNNKKQSQSEKQQQNHEKFQKLQQPPKSSHSMNQIQKLHKKAFINRLFKTNQHLVVEQKKRKYLYEYEKSDILNQIQEPILTNMKELRKTMRQIKNEKKENQLMRGFILRYSQSYSANFFKNKQNILRTYCGFFYYKQLVTTPHLIQFIFALTFDRQLPLEFTILKIVDEYLQCPKTFKQNLLAISKQHYLKFLRASTNFILKIFKKIDTIMETKDTEQSKGQILKLNNWQDKQEETYSADDFSSDDFQFQSEKQKLNKKLAEETQKFPKSKQKVDLELIRFAFSIFQVSIQRIVGQIKSKRKLLLESGQFQMLSFDPIEQKELKSLHQTLMLSFDIYTTIEAIFASIEINDFTDLDKLSHGLTSYNKIRKFLAQNISTVHKFMINYDKQYEQKLELGLGSIMTQKQLRVQNFILKNQARKLNFDIIDNIASMLKHDNLQITLENKRMNIFSVLERIFEVYIENDMIDFLEDELIYNIVRFLQKQVYLDNKIRSLFEARVNFDAILIAKDKEIMRGNENQENQIQPQTTERSKKSSKMDVFGLDPSDQYDFSRTQPTQQNPFVSQGKKQRSSSSLSNEFEWFQLQSVYPSEQQSRKSYNFDSLVFDRTEKSQYFMGKIGELFSKQLLYNLIRIIKHKHDRREIMIEQINGFNLIQEWYSEPTVVRLQFLKQEIIERYKRMSRYQANSRLKKY